MRRRWERALARINKSLDWLLQVREEKRLGRPGARKWQERIEAARQRLEDQARIRSARSAPQPPKTATVLVAAAMALPAFASRPLPVPIPGVHPESPPPAPSVEFVQERGGMSIAIDTATGQMASSAAVLAALNKG